MNSLAVLCNEILNTDRFIQVVFTQDMKTDCYHIKIRLVDPEQDRDHYLFLFQCLPCKSDANIMNDLEFIITKEVRQAVEKTTDLSEEFFVFLNAMRRQARFTMFEEENENKTINYFVASDYIRKIWLTEHTNSQTNKIVTIFNVFCSYPKQSGYFAVFESHFSVTVNKPMIKAKAFFIEQQTIKLFH